MKGYLSANKHQVSNLLGELSSVIRDGDVFGSFLTDEGCGSPLAKQTLDQAAVGRADFFIGENLGWADWGGFGWLIGLGVGKKS